MHYYIITQTCDRKENVRKMMRYRFDNFYGPK